MFPRLHVPGIASVAVANALLLAACGSTSPAPSGSAAPSGSPAPSASLLGPTPSPSAASPATLVLRVTNEGGFIGPVARLATVPAVSVYADGRILVPGPTTEQLPQPLVPSVLVRDVGPAGIAQIRAAITAAALNRTDASYPAGGMPDAGDTVFRATLDGRTVTTRFGGFGVVGHGPGGPGGSSPDPLRAAAEALLARLVDPTDAWGGTATAPTAYVPNGYRVWVVPGTRPGADPSAAQAPVAWPLAMPLATFGAVAVPDRGITGLRVGTVTGPRAATLAPILAAATTSTVFTSGGAEFTLYVVPLLPEETGG